MPPQKDCARLGEIKPRGPLEQKFTFGALGDREKSQESWLKSGGDLTTKRNCFHYLRNTKRSRKGRGELGDHLKVSGGKRNTPLMGVFTGKETRGGGDENPLPWKKERDSQFGRPQTI